MDNLALNIKKYRKLSKLTQKDLAKLLKVAPTAISAWEVGRNKPLMDNVEQMAIIFKIKKSKLLGDDLTLSSSPTTLTEITNTSAKLDEPRQQNVLHYAQEQLAEQNNTIEEESATYFTSVKVHQSLAAGIGYAYSDDTTANIMHTDRSDLKVYDYASLVSGDSMEPKFYDGDVVLIQQGYDNINGGIYAVDYDGKSFLKRVYVENGSFVMKSINTKYKDITVPLPIPEGTYLNIIGKVVDSFTPIGK